jgi:hypothetical protein
MKAAWAELFESFVVPSENQATDDIALSMSH